MLLVVMSIPLKLMPLTFLFCYFSWRTRFTCLLPVSSIITRNDGIDHRDHRLSSWWCLWSVQYSLWRNFYLDCFSLMMVCLPFRRFLFFFFLKRQNTLPSAVEMLFTLCKKEQPRTERRKSRWKGNRQKTANVCKDVSLGKDTHDFERSRFSKVDQGFLFVLVSWRLLLFVSLDHLFVLSSSWLSK